MEMLTSRRYLNLYSEYSLCCALLQWAVSEAKRRQFNPADWLLIRGILQERYGFSLIKVRFTLS
jgi:hypothetical protein